MYKITTRSNIDGSVGQVTLTGPQVKKARQRWERQGIVITSSVPVRA